MEITGIIKNIRFRNDENGWTVMDLENTSGEHLVAVGVMPEFGIGETVKLTGNMQEHPRFGSQLKVDSAEAVLPTEANDIEAYLASGVIRGIGPSTAAAIVARFGADTFTVMDDTPEKLCEIGGIGKKRLAIIMESYMEKRASRDLMLKLEHYGITPALAQKLYKTYGVGCIDRVEENPYQLCEDVDGVGFVTADSIAQRMDGFSYDSPARIRAGIRHALDLAAQEYGHTCLPKENLLSFVQRLLGVPMENVSDTVDDLIGDGDLVYRMSGERDCLFLPYLARMESEAAEKLLKLNAGFEPDPFLTGMLEIRDTEIRLSEQQEQAVRQAVSSGVSVITGGPGTGKTTIIRCIADILDSLQMDYALTAPTGRASKRMSEATGRDAKTIHRLLEYIPGEGFQRDDEALLTYDMIIVDEVSMVDIPLLWALLRAVTPGTMLLLVGDADQLPSVGPGNVLRDIIRSNTIPCVRLTEIYRQAAMSKIVTNAHLVNEGSMPELDTPSGSDFLFEEIPDPQSCVDRILSIYRDADGSLKSGDPLMDIQVLAPMKKQTLGVYNLNTVLQEALNPPSRFKVEQAFGDTVLRVGDKVMQIKNDYKLEWTKRGPGGTLIEGTGVFNGDIGTVFRIDPAEKHFTILFDDDRLCQYEFGQKDEIDLAYCISIHKSQGSEFPIVILPLCGGPPVLMTRNLLYTAITRAKSQVYLIGRRQTVSTMVASNTAKERYTSLSEQLREWESILK